MASIIPKCFLLFAVIAHLIFLFAKGELGQCEVSKDGRNLEIAINRTSFDNSYVRGFSIHNRTGKFLQQVVNYEKPSLVPRCRYKCNAENFPNVTTTDKYIKLNVSLTAGPLADLTPFTVLLDVDGHGNFHFNPLVCSKYLNHTVEDLTLDSGSMMTTARTQKNTVEAPSTLKSTSATRKIQPAPDDDQETTGKATGHKTLMVSLIVPVVVLILILVLYCLNKYRKRKLNSSEGPMELSDIQHE